MSSMENGNTNGSNGFSGASLFSQEYARSLDFEDPLRHFRSEFLIPTRDDLKRKTVPDQQDKSVSEESTYLCGNSLGLQPRLVRDYVNAQLELWNTKGVYGHHKDVENSPIPAWLNLDDEAAKLSAHIVGADPSEITIMQTLTANLHFLMSSFYQPTKDRYKIIIEAKAFPSDHFAVQSQIQHHKLSPDEAMILIQPPEDSFPLIPTEHILSVIDQHASSTALLLLPGIQYYTGQFFDIKTITAYAQSKGITVGWDLAHAVGNVPVQLHEWNVDFAAWCNYKYMNSGPGAMGGLFVHSRHTTASSDTRTTNGHSHSSSGEDSVNPPRLTGWWGSSKATRFLMNNEYTPIPGAGGFQVSNPSALDLSAVLASLTVFAKTDMQSLRQKSLRLTRYLEELLTTAAPPERATARPWTIITPSDPKQRGAQLSVRLEPGLLDHVMGELEDQGVVTDERRPDVVRVAPTPLYNSFEDCWRFASVLHEACGRALEAQRKKGTA